jgi:hypothetical protein
LSSTASAAARRRRPAARSKVANPVGETADPQKLQLAGQLERTIALTAPSDGHSRTSNEMKVWKTAPDCWVAGGEAVALAVAASAVRPERNGPAVVRGRWPRSSSKPRC